MRTLIAFVAVLLWQTIVLGQAVNDPPFVSFTPTAASNEALNAAAVAFSQDQEAMLAQSNAIVPREPSPALMDTAQDHANFMARYPCHLAGGMYQNPVFSHDTNGGSRGRLQRHGWQGIRSQEILAMRPAGWRASCWEIWRDSPGHWQAVMSNNTHCGFGAATGEDGCTYYVGLFGTETKPAPRQNVAGTGLTLEELNRRTAPPPDVSREAWQRGEIRGPSISEQYDQSALASSQAAGTGKHYFLSRTEPPFTACATCGRSIYDEIHPWKNVSDQSAGPATASVPVAFIRGSCGPGGCGTGTVQRRAVVQYRGPVRRVAVLPQQQVRRRLFGWRG